MNFTSQICTTKEQSERLLALGLKKETADCILVENAFKKDSYLIFPIEIIDETFKNELHDEPIPAWSLHRLIKMLNYQVIHNGKKYEPVIAIDGMAYRDVCSDDPIVGWLGDLYTDIIDCIEWLIKEGYFNKEYLN